MGAEYSPKTLSVILCPVATRAPLRQEKPVEQVLETAIRNAVANSTNLLTEEDKSQFYDYL